jgi:hypothetical protein
VDAINLPDLANENLNLLVKRQGWVAALQIIRSSLSGARQDESNAFRP